MRRNGSWYLERHLREEAERKLFYGPPEPEAVLTIDGRWEVDPPQACAPRSSGSCRQCGKPRPDGCTVTCGASECQEAEAQANRERARRRRRPRA